MPATLPRTEVLAIVSDLAHGRSVIDVAARHHISAEAVKDIRNQHGDDLGALAKSADRLRAEIGHAPVIDAAGTPVTDQTLILLEKAAALPKLATKAARCIALLTDIRNGMADAEKAEKLAAIIARRKADLAEAERQLAELKATSVKKVTGGEPTSAQIRAWAATNGVDCPAFGRVPQSVVEAWKAAQK
jgi:hypothetical protein